MPDWTAPFRIPEMSTEEYARQKAEYTARNGYTITIPGLSDIIKIRTEAPISALENYWWKNKEWDKFGPVRLEEVKKQKEKRRERYLSMLKSPTPSVVQNAGSIMTAIDDAQDAISTLAAIGQLARKVAPKILGKILRGPTGLLLIASDALNLVQAGGMYCMAPMYGKRAGEELAKGSPKGIKRRLKQRMWSKARLPTKGDWIQGLQTTEQIFGFGISLGPIVGLVQDTYIGAVRAAVGQEVKLKLPVPDFQHWYKIAVKVLKSMPMLWGTAHFTDEDEILSWTAAALLSFQAAMNVTAEWNPLEMLNEIETLEVPAPEPWHILTQEVIAEGPVDPATVIGWLATGTKWAPIKTIMDATHQVAADNILNFAKRNKHSWTGYAGLLCANEMSAYSLATLENEGDVAYDYSCDFTTCQVMIEHGIMLDPEQPYEKFVLFKAYLEDCEEAHYTPTIQSVIEFCYSPWNDIKLRQQAGFPVIVFPE